MFWGRNDRAEITPKNREVTCIGGCGRKLSFAPAHPLNRCESHNGGICKDCYIKQLEEKIKALEQNS